MEKKKYNLMERLKIIDECTFKGEKEFFPSLSFIKEKTNIKDYEDRNYYLWVLLNLSPNTEEDLNCCDYMIKKLEEFDPQYYKDLRKIISDHLD